MLICWVRANTQDAYSMVQVVAAAQLSRRFAIKTALDADELFSEQLTTRSATEKLPRDLLDRVGAAEARYDTVLSPALYGDVYDEAWFWRAYQAVLPFVTAYDLLEHRLDATRQLLADTTVTTPLTDDLEVLEYRGLKGPPPLAEWLIDPTVAVTTRHYSRPQPCVVFTARPGYEQLFESRRQTFAHFTAGHEALRAQAEAALNPWSTLLRRWARWLLAPLG